MAIERRSRAAVQRPPFAVRRLALELLESRLLCTTTPTEFGWFTPSASNGQSVAPSIVFDPTAGLLTIRGNSADEEIFQGLTSDGFLELTLAGVTQSSRPDSPLYDARLAGATRDTLRKIVFQGGGGSDSLVLNDQRLAASLEVASDGDLTIAGSIHVAGAFQASAATINVSGSIVAPSGTVRLLSTTATIVSGTLDVAGGAGGVGGRAEILGPIVALVDSALVTATGAQGGGVILVGGDFQGRNADVLNAQHTFVSAGAEIHADALASGSGGQVIVWADVATRFYGTATARGGSDLGDGGLIEVSGKEHLEFRGTVDLSAAGGQHRNAVCSIPRIWSLPMERSTAPPTELARFPALPAASSARS